MILGIIVIFLFAGVYTYYQVGSFSENLAYQTALRESQRYAETLKSFRGLYTSEVVSEVTGKKRMKVTHDYKTYKDDSVGAIPLPATLSMMLAEKMTTDSTIVKLYSKYPFPWRKDRKTTDFESRAFDYFEKHRDSNEPFFEIDKEHAVVRYAIADKMVSMSCVNCHNNHPQSPKRGWALGDVRGAISIEKPVNTSSISQAQSSTIIILGVIAVFVLISLAIVISRIKSVRNSIQTSKSIIEQLQIGDLPDRNVEVPENEMKEVVAGLNVLNQNFKNVTSFAESIGKGQLTTQFRKLSEKDSLGNALIEMRNSLQQVTEADAKRNWSTSGLAQLGETLRIHLNGSGEMYDQIIKFLVKYTKSNQGGIFILNNDDEKDEFLELVACYAYDRKKHLTRRVEKGEGFVGQCYLEGEGIYIKKVPTDFVKITSGLGGAVPNALVVIPLKINEKIYGVLELMSFNEYEPHEIEFLNKACESVASFISSARLNEKTRLLLERAQQQAEELKAQEEEMRQNMEELSATQEEMSRKEKEYVRRIKDLTGEA